MNEKKELERYEAQPLMTELRRIQYLIEVTGREVDVGSLKDTRFNFVKGICDIAKVDDYNVLSAIITDNNLQPAVVIWYPKLESFIIIRVEDSDIWSISVISDIPVYEVLDSTTNNFFEKTLDSYNYYYNDYSETNNKLFTIWIDDKKKLFQRFERISKIFESSIKKSA